MRSVLVLFETAGNPSKQHLLAYLNLLLSDTTLDIKDIVLADEYEISGRDFRDSSSVEKDQPLLTEGGEPLTLG